MDSFSSTFLHVHNRVPWLHIHLKVSWVLMVFILELIRLPRVFSTVIFWATSCFDWLLAKNITKTLETPKTKKIEDFILQVSVFNHISSNFHAINVNV